MRMLACVRTDDLRVSGGPFKMLVSGSVSVLLH